MISSAARYDHFDTLPYNMDTFFLCKTKYMIIIGLSIKTNRRGWLE